MDDGRWTMGNEFKSVPARRLSRCCSTRTVVAGSHASRISGWGCIWVGEGSDRKLGTTSPSANPGAPRSSRGLHSA